MFPIDMRVGSNRIVEARGRDALLTRHDWNDWELSRGVIDDRRTVARLVLQPEQRRWLVRMPDSSEAAFPSFNEALEHALVR